ncbi:MAG TPA: hypothetical protein VGR20_06510, partial [Acidimicrobiia bacterium]|nr:hypothetical protein [Acidimicrobiia bacterium]
MSRRDVPGGAVLVALVLALTVGLALPSAATAPRRTGQVPAPAPTPATGAAAPTDVAAAPKPHVLTLAGQTAWVPPGENVQLD